MERTVGTIIAFLAVTLIAWKGYKKFKNPTLWIGFLPIFSIIHTFMGWHVLSLAFQYDTNPDQFPLYASILSPSYFTVALFGLPLEFLGLPDDIAYSIAFGLNAVLIATIVSLIIQWLINRRSGNNA